jgi:protein disulfide-isomerase-like protein
MAKILHTIGLALLANALELDDLNEESSNAVVLDTSNFYDLVVDTASNRLKSEKPWFIKFYAPWCGHCKRLAPTWEELATLHPNELNVGKVDCTTDLGKPLCSDYEVRGFPTVLFFPAGEDLNDRYYKYEGMRSLSDLEDFALKGSFSSS